MKTENLRQKILKTKTKQKEMFRKNNETNFRLTTKIEFIKCVRRGRESTRSTLPSTKNGLSLSIDGRTFFITWQRHPKHRCAIDSDLWFNRNKVCFECSAKWMSLYKCEQTHFIPTTRTETNHRFLLSFVFDFSESEAQSACRFLSPINELCQ